MNQMLLQEWITKLPIKDQSMLVSALRGCDVLEHNLNINIGGNLKVVTKMIRYLIINDDSGGKTKYTTTDVIDINTVIKTIGYYGRVASLHWYEHILGTMKLIAKHYPNVYTTNYYTTVISNMLTKIPNLPDYIYRLQKEKYELEEKISKLDIWISTNDADKIDFDQPKQLELMLNYQVILSDRLTKFYTENSLKTINGDLDIDKY